jgi:hypothetical protein
MSYREKIHLIKNAIMRGCRELIEKNWAYCFNNWITCEGEYELPAIYEQAYAAELELDNEAKLILLICARNLAYAISAHLHWDSQISDICAFTEDMIDRQLDGFSNPAGEDE